MKPLTMETEEILALKEMGKARIVRAVEPQPKHTDKWTTLTYFPKDGEAIENGPDYPDDESDVRIPPFRCGDEFWVRETWKPCMEGYSSYVEYKLDYFEKKVDISHIEAIAKKSGASLRFEGAKKELVNHSWRLSTQMPQWASRYTVRTLQINVEQIGSVWYWVGSVEVVR